MSAVLDPIRNRTQRFKTLVCEYELVDARKCAHYDEDAIKDKAKSLKEIASSIRMATGGVDRDLTFQDKLIVAITQQLLSKDGINQPEGNTKGLEGDEKKAKEKAISDYWKLIEETIDKIGADIYTSMDDNQKPFGGIALADGSEQKTIEGAIVEAADEKNKKPKGKRAGKVTTKKIEDDGSEAEAASECVTMSEEASQETATTAEESASTSDTATETESAKTAENESTEPKTTSESTTETESGSSKRKAPLSLVPKNNKKAVK